MGEPSDRSMPLEMYVLLYYTIRWSSAKSAELKAERGTSFEEVIRDKVVGILKHPARPRQWLLLFEREGYIWVVPFVKRGKEIFLKTLFPSRKYTKLWKKGVLGYEAY